MEQKDIDIYEILKGMPDGTPLYTPLCGNVEFTSVVADKNKSEAIWTENKNGELSFNKNGKWMEGGEVLLFPSKEMRDWSKFFKKGDVLEFKDGSYQGTCIFDSYEDDLTKLRFVGKYTFTAGKISETPTSFRTVDWVKSDDPAGYIKAIEHRLCGKLNLETLEIEKNPAFEIGKLYVFDEQDEDGDVTVIGELIGKDESEDTLTFGIQYEIDTDKFVTDQTFDLNISLHKELRKATEIEVEMFSRHYSIWKEKEEKAMSKCSFKPFDKVLVRDGKEYEWLPALFFRDRGEGANYRYKVLPLRKGNSSEYACCIPFEGNEHLAFTDEDFEDLPF